MLRDYLGELPIGAAADRLGIDAQQLERIIAGADPVAPAMASSLGEFFGTSVELWTGMEAQYDAWNSK